MNLSKPLAVLLVFLLLLSAGCLRMGNLKDMKDRIFPGGPSEYEIKMERKDISSMEKNLSANIYPIDTQLSRLMRRLSVMDAYPGLEWKQEISRDFFWLNGIALVSRNREILSRYPETGIKQLEYKPVFPRAMELPQGRTMLDIEDTTLGPEILISSAVYRDFQVDGLIIAHFDPRTFMAQSAEPVEIILATADRIIWPGKYSELEDELAQVDWEGLTRRKVSGKIRLKDQNFFWFARAVGQDWLIYLIKDS